MMAYLISILTLLGICSVHILGQKLEYGKKENSAIKHASQILNNIEDRGNLPKINAEFKNLQQLVDQMRQADVDKAQPGDIVLNWGYSLSDGNRSNNASGPLFISVNESLFQREVYIKLRSIYYQQLFVPNVICLIFFILNLLGMCNTNIGSSGFEHVYFGEYSATVSGQHNWVIYYLLQKDNDINYQGYYSHEGDLVGTWQYSWYDNGINYTKPMGGFFIGTSPAFDLAIYTVCALTQPGNSTCTFSMDGTYDISITSYVQNCTVGTCLSTAYPGLATTTKSHSNSNSRITFSLFSDILIGMATILYRYNNN
uniref:Endoribonuclease n=1 Tax=Acrobeloides nanus TaxID=290746 RepID=A0A914EL56_9BILA